MPLSSQMDEQVGIFDNMTRSHDTGTRSFETNQSSTVELPSVSTLLLPMTSTNESTSIPSQPVKQAAVMFSSNNGVIDDPLIQSLAAEQAASAHNYDLLSHRHKRVFNRYEKKIELKKYYSKFFRFDVHYVMAINQLVRRIFNFY